jgi:preprotein translocase subunit SecE
MTSNSKAVEGNASPRQQTMDAVKLGVTAVLVLTAIVLYHTFSQVSQLYRVLGLFAVAGVAIFLVLQTAMGRDLVGYIKAAHLEVRKVVWPTRQETMHTTLAVFVVVVLVSLFLWLLDYLISTSVHFLTGQGG